MFRLYRKMQSLDCSVVVKNRFLPIGIGPAAVTSTIWGAVLLRTYIERGYLPSLLAGLAFLFFTVSVPWIMLSLCTTFGRESVVTGLKFFGGMLLFARELRYQDMDAVEYSMGFRLLPHLKIRSKKTDQMTNVFGFGSKALPRALLLLRSNLDSSALDESMKFLLAEYEKGNKPNLLSKRSWRK
jgi:hypothetical protein